MGKGSTFWVLEKGVSEVQESLQQMSFTRSFQAEHLLESRGYAECRRTNHD